jgi:site-specific DNA-methyltransferase (adenine-specific)
VLRRGLVCRKIELVLTEQHILNVDARELTPIEARDFDVMLTDPPYSRHVHKSAVSQSKGGGTRKREFGFEHLDAGLRRHVGALAANVKRWSVVYSDVEHATYLRVSGQAAGATYVRTMPWIRWSMPQLSGDRPPQGFEALLLFWGHSPAGEKSWNGPGNLTHLSHTCLRGEEKHRAEKPLDQALDLVSWFSEPGETVLDPFAGSGVMGLACRLLGRSYCGLELDPEWATRARARLDAPLSARDQERVSRWLSATSDDSAGTEPARERAAKREQDRARLA